MSVPPDRTQLPVDLPVVRRPRSRRGSGLGRRGLVRPDGVADQSELPASGGDDPAPICAREIAAGEGAVWVTAMLDDTVSRIDPTTNRVTKTIRVGRGIDGIAAGEGAVWVANSFDDTISRIDPRTNTVVARVPVKSAPGQISTGAGGVWVTTSNKPGTTPKNAVKIGVLSDCRGLAGSAYNETLATAELPMLERGGRRAGSTITDGVEGVSVGGRPVTALLRLCRRDEWLRTGRGATLSRAGRGRHLDRAADGR